MLTVDLARAGIGPGTRVLDLGCGGGRHAFACAKRGAEVVALDADEGELAPVAALFAAMAEAGELPPAARNVVMAADAGSLPFPDACFHRVIAAEILEHLPEDGAALRELARVLHPMGLLALSVPRAGPEALNWLLSSAYHEVKGGHIRIYRRSQLRARLAAAGLEVVGRHHAHALHTPYWWLRCLVGVERADHPLVAAYHRLLVHEIVHAPRLLRLFERLCSPLFGKSLVLYCRPASPLARPHAPGQPAAQTHRAASPQRSPARPGLLPLGGSRR